MNTDNTTQLPDSLWAATAIPATDYPTLKQDIDCEVCIVGAGFTGLSAALHIAESGTKVVVLESVEPGWGASGRNGGQVVPGFKITPAEVKRKIPLEYADRLITFAGIAPDLVFDLIEKYDIDCHAERHGWMQAAHHRKMRPALEALAKDWQGYGANVEWIDETQVAELLGTNCYAGGLLDARGGKLQPLSYARGLAAAAHGCGAAIYTHSPAKSLRKKNRRWQVLTQTGSVNAHNVLLCTNAYTDQLWSGLKTSVIPAFSYQVATEPLPATMQETILPRGQAVADTKRLLIYFRIDDTGRLMLGGRGKFKETNDPVMYRQIVKTLYTLYPPTKSLKLDYFWSGQVALTMDTLPHLHELADGVFTGLGYNGRGVALSTAMGKALAERVNGQRDADSPFPVSPLKPIPLHAMRIPVMHVLTGARKMLDAWETS